MEEGRSEKKAEERRFSDDAAVRKLAFNISECSLRTNKPAQSTREGVWGSRLTHGHLSEAYINK